VISFGYEPAATKPLASEVSRNFQQFNYGSASLSNLASSHAATAKEALKEFVQKPNRAKRRRTAIPHLSARLTP
jgi:hypothetical protein